MSGDVVIVCGGAGFVGSAVMRHLIRATGARDTTRVLRALHATHSV